MNQTLILTSLNRSEKEEASVELASVCPICGHALTPDVLYASLIEYDDYNKNKVFLLNYCPKCECEFISYHTYIDDSDYYKYISSSPSRIAKHEFSDNILSLSPQFVDTFNESLQAETLGMTSICGMGYRKALEFLIKDYVISKNPDHQSDIERLPLSQCINSYMPDERLKTLARASTWLGNDQTHYVQKHTSHGLEELKRFITAFVTFIEADLAFQDAQSFISGSSV